MLFSITANLLKETSSLRAAKLTLSLPCLLPGGGTPSALLRYGQILGFYQWEAILYV